MGPGCVWLGRGPARGSCRLLDVLFFGLNQFQIFSFSIFLKFCFWKLDLNFEILFLNFEFFFLSFRKFLGDNYLHIVDMDSCIVLIGIGDL